jgi:hypothetical protein
MSITHTFTNAWSNGAGNTLSSQVQVTDGAELNISEPIPANQTNLAVSCVVANAKMKSLWLQADVAMTIKVNSTSAPDATIALVANQAVVWAGSGSNPFGSSDNTVLYVTNTTAGTLNVRIVKDPT